MRQDHQGAAALLSLKLHARRLLSALLSLKLHARRLLFYLQLVGSMLHRRRHAARQSRHCCHC
jgi:hypothetical protein